jgi:hypothetical protein
MKTATVLSVIVLLLAFSASTYALETKCVVVGPAASELSLIAQRAADVQRVADEMEAYLRTGAPSWETLAYKMVYLEEGIADVRKALRHFESREPALTETQRQHLERLKSGLATLTVFVNNTNRVIAEKRFLPNRNALVSNARAMSVRAGIIRKAARNLRISEAA